MKMSDMDLEIKELEMLMEKMAGEPRLDGPPIRSPGEKCMYEKTQHRIDSEPTKTKSE
jgi:hypothetical protein